MKKLFLLLSVLALSLIASAAIPNLTKSTPLTLTATSDGFTQSDNAKALEDGEWINWPDGTIHEGFAKWRVNVVNNGIYMVTLDMKCNNTYMFRTSVINPSTSETIATARSAKVDHGSGYSNTTEAGGSLNLVGLEAGEYYISVTDTIKWSEGKLRGITLTYVNGATIAIPATLQPADALLSSRAWVDKTGAIDSILFTPRGSEGYNDQEWAKWNVSVAKAGYYKFTAHVCRPNGSQKYEIKVLSADESSELLTHTDNSISSGTRTTTTNKVELAAGNYVIKIRNTYNYAESRVLGIDATYEGGATTTIPATLVPEDALLSSRAWVDKTGAVDSILFTSRGSEGHNPDEWAKWKIKVTTAGYYKFKANVSSSDGQYYKISVLNSAESSTIGEKDGTGSSLGSGNKSFSTDNIELSAGEYVVKIANTYAYSHGRVLNIVATYEGGAPTTIPGLLKAEDAIVVSPPNKLQHETNGDLKYGDNGTPSNEYAYWRITTTGTYSGKVTLNIPQENSSGPQFHVELYSDLEGAKLSEAYEAEDNHSKGVIELSQTFEISSSGTYFIKLVNATQWSSAILRSISIAPAITLDEEATSIATVIEPNDGKAVNAQLSRSFTGGMYNTICLPFAVSAAEKSRIFGEATLLDLDDAYVADNILYMNFVKVNEMEAGRPYIISPLANISNPKFLGVTIDKSSNNAEFDDVDFKGTFVQTTIDASEDNLFLGSGNTLYFPTDTKTIKGMRGWFEVHSSSGAPVRQARIVAHGDVVTEVELIGNDLPETFGNKVQKLIENGQLILIRDGVRYNIIGVRVK